MENSTEQDTWLPPTDSCPNATVCIVEVTVVIAVTFLILVGNIGNLVILLSTHKLRNSHGYLLISLSASDLMTGLMASVAIYPSATLRSSPGSWPFGDTACLVVAYITQVAMRNSAANLMLLSLERYVAIAHPLRYARTVTKKHTLICIAFTWLISAGIFASIFAGFPKYYYFPQLYMCLPFLFGDPLFAWLMFVNVSIPCLIILVTSCIVSINLRAGSRKGTGIVATQSGTNIKMRTFRMVQVMTAAFILSYVPFFTILFFIIQEQVSMPQVVMFGVYWLLIANSFFNSVIYVTMNTAYRKRMGEIFNSVAATCRMSLSSRERSGSQLSILNTVDSTNLPDSDWKTSASSSNIRVDCQDSVL